MARVAGQVADAVARQAGDRPACRWSSAATAPSRSASSPASAATTPTSAWSTSTATPTWAARSASDGSGILDSTGVAHLLGHGTPELCGLAGPGPLLEPGRLALVGGDPRETDDAGRRFLAETGVSFQEAPGADRRPGRGRGPRAGRHRPRLAARLVVHFDVDTVDSGDLPLANFPHYGSGVRLSHVVTCLQVLRAAPAFAGLVLTEVNPTHDPGGAQLARYVAAITAASPAGARQLTA